jgi:hypothetical protein
VPDGRLVAVWISRLPAFGAGYDESMKKKKNATRQVRISLSAYERIRRIAFRRHEPMKLILEEIIKARA